MALNHYTFSSIISASLCSNALHFRGVKAVQKPPGVFHVWLSCVKLQLEASRYATQTPVCGQMTTLTQSVSLSAKGSLYTCWVLQISFLLPQSSTFEGLVSVLCVSVLFMSLWMHIHRAPSPPHPFTTTACGCRRGWFQSPWSLRRMISPVENMVSLHLEMEELIFNSGFLQGPKPAPDFKDMLVFLEGSFKISI